ncbi:MAG: hypothetical protein NTU94_02865 [Planctomycetota bacterium]|nr:hypothetical protein [Planctomycetota bacterium]
MDEESGHYTDMLHPFAEEGLWWLPENEKEQISGILRYDPVEGLRLRLMGSFCGHGIDKEERRSLILGFLARGKPVTLYNSVFVGGCLSIPGYATCEYLPSCAFFGAHFDPEKVKFGTVYERIHNVEECIGYKALVEEWDIDDKKGAYGYKVYFRKPEEVAFPIPLADFRIAWTFTTTGSTPHAKGISTAAWFRFAISQPSPYLEVLQGPVSLIHTLVELAADCRLPILVAELYSPVLLDESPEGEPREVPVSLVWDQQLKSSTPRAKNSWELMFTLESVKTRLGDILRRWERFRARHNSTFETYFLLLRTQHEMPWQHQFLSLVYALESYHRRKSAQGKHRQSFRDRMKEVFLAMPQCVRQLIAGEEVFAAQVADTRNYYAHQDEKLKSVALKDWQLYLAIVKLQAVLRGVRLSELGFADEEIAVILDRLRYPHQIHNLSLHL